MKKFAYTIAETLITLAIIGVIGAITLPTFISNHRNQTNASALSVAISNMENALTTTMMKKGLTNLVSGDFWTRVWQACGGDCTTNSLIQLNRRVGFIRALENGMAISYNDSYRNMVDYYNGITLRDINGNVIEATALREDLREGNIAQSFRGSTMYIPYIAKNGVVYFMKYPKRSSTESRAGALSEAQSMAAGGALTRVFASVIIDVNGKQLPNTIGRDIFKFDLGDDGILYPCGSVDYSVMNQELSNTTWRDPSCNWTCTDNEKDDLGFGCTARLIDENFKPTY